MWLIETKDFSINKHKNRTPQTTLFCFKINERIKQPPNNTYHSSKTLKQNPFVDL